MLRTLTLMLVLAIAALSNRSAAAEPPQPNRSSGVLEIGSERQLFLDELIVERRDGISLTMNAPYQTGELLIAADAPWEQGPDTLVWGNCGTVLEDQGKIRVWYNVLSLTPKPQPVGFEVADSWLAYAESSDGIHFEKPILNLCEHRGSKANNLLAKGRLGWIVWIDTHADASSRYRAVLPVEPYGTFEFLQSPDGIAWTSTHRTNVGHNDTYSSVFWDPAVERYLLYTRLWEPDPLKAGSALRSHRRLESDDLVHWSNETAVLRPDAADLHKYPTPAGGAPVDFYGGNVFKYPDERGFYVMLAEPYWHWYPRPDGQEPGPNTYDVRLLASRDGKQFTWLGDRRPLLRYGTEGSFYSRSLWPMSDAIRRGDELWIYYQGQNFDHSGVLDPQATHMRAGITRAVLRADGFISADAGPKGGELVTKPFRFTGDTLQVNLDTSAGGAMFVEIQDEAGQPIAGYAESDCDVLCGNSVHMTVRWHGRPDVKPLEGKNIRLRFRMIDCRLYAFQFHCTS
jgi:hypothetical protein